MKRMMYAMCILHGSSLERLDGIFSQQFIIKPLAAVTLGVLHRSRDLAGNIVSEMTDDASSGMLGPTQLRLCSWWPCVAG